MEGPRNMAGPKKRYVKPKLARLEPTHELAERIRAAALQRPVGDPERAKGLKMAGLIDASADGATNEQQRRRAFFQD